MNLATIFLSETVGTAMLLLDRSGCQQHLAEEQGREPGS